MLAVSRGLPFASIEDLLKAAFVEAARRAQPESAGQRIVSRIATATGLTRREVTRLLDAPRGLPPARPSLGDPALHALAQRPDPARSARPRQSRCAGSGAGAKLRGRSRRSITQDVHPRPARRLCRLGLAVEEGDRVKLARDSVVAERDSERAYGFSPATSATICAPASPTFSPTRRRTSSRPSLQTNCRKSRWLPSASSRSPMAGRARRQRSRVAGAGRCRRCAAGRVADRRVRLGLYSYHEKMNGAVGKGVPRGAAAPRRARTARRSSPKDR